MLEIFIVVGLVVLGLLLLLFGASVITALALLFTRPADINDIAVDDRISKGK